MKGEVVCWTRITGLPPAANYDAAYREKNRGKVAATIPEVYELINVVIALTETAEKSDELVYKSSPYWKELQAWFGPYKDDPLVKAIDARMKSNGAAYFTLKMNGNSFEFNPDGHIVNRKIYARTGFAGGGENDLRPFVPELKRFAEETKFRDFYRTHGALYASECESFVKDIDPMGMRNWLQSRFSDKKPYDFVDVIFSPVVPWNQSSTWFESNGFRTLQPHVNYPYPEDVPKRNPPSAPETASVFRGIIVFTEMNHGYLSPQSEQNSARILAATDKVKGWLVERMRNNYAGTAVFDEYMNWGVGSVYALDTIPTDADLT